MPTTAPTPIFLAYAHPIGEDAGVLWMAAGRSPAEARARLEAKIRDAEWDDEDDKADLDDEASWVFTIDEDAI